MRPRGATSRVIAANIRTALTPRCLWRCEGFDLQGIHLDAPRATDGRLCSCECHADCPATSGGWASWPEDCDCNKTRQMRHRQQRRAARGADKAPDRLNLGRVLGRSISEMSRRRQASAVGHTTSRRQLDRSASSAIVAEEWRRHRLQPPTGVVMDRWADQIADPPSLAEQTVNNARILRDLVGLPFPCPSRHQRWDRSAD